MCTLGWGLGGGACAAVPAEGSGQSSLPGANCSAFPFTRGNAREASAAARCHMATKCSPPAQQRGEGCPSRFHPCCPLPPQLSLPGSPICPVAVVVLGSFQASNEEDRCWGHPCAESLSQLLLPSRLLPSLLERAFLSGTSLPGFQRAETYGKKAQLWDFTPKTLPALCFCSNRRWEVRDNLHPRSLCGATSLSSATPLTS